MSSKFQGLSKSHWGELGFVDFLQSFVDWKGGWCCCYFLHVVEQFLVQIGGCFASQGWLDSLQWSSVLQ